LIVHDHDETPSTIALKSASAIAEMRRGKLKTRKTNYQEAPMSYFRTPEHRRLRAELIRGWSPWERSSGPRTAAGKARASRNADKGGMRRLLRDLRRVLRAQQCGIRELI